MKHALITHVDQERIVMFKDSTDEVKTGLSRMMTAIEETMNNKSDEVFLMMRRDYLAALGGPDLAQGEVMPKWQRLMRREVMKIIDGSEKVFKRIAGLEVDDEEDVSGDSVRDIFDDDMGDEDERPLKDDEPLLRTATPASSNSIAGNNAKQAESEDVKMQDPDRQPDNAPPSVPAGTNRAIPEDHKVPEQATIQSPPPDGITKADPADTQSAELKDLKGETSDTPATTNEASAEGTTAATNNLQPEDKDVVAPSENSSDHNYDRAPFERNLSEVSDCSSTPLVKRRRSFMASVADEDKDEDEEA